MNTMHNGHMVTDEQQATIDWAIKYGAQKIEAFAGSGKTHTLGAISAALMNQGKKGLYIAFNKAIADEAKSKMPWNVECRTAHSLAYREVGSQYQNEGRLGKCWPNIIAQQFKIRAIAPKTAIGVAGNVLSTITRFCYSSDSQINGSHVPMGDYYKAGFGKDDILAIRDLIRKYAIRVWESIASPNGRTPITHDVYLKLWAMNQPKLECDFILFDEAQDANPVMTDLVLNQNATPMIVGDRYQQIYSWRGAENALQSIEMKEHWITQSFRFGQSIADIANYILNSQLNAGVNIKGFDKIESTVRALSMNEIDCIISRTNADLISNVFDAIDNDEKVHIQGGTSQLVTLIREIEKLKNGKRSEHQELCIFENYAQLQEYSETDQGMDLKLPINLINKHGARELMQAIESSDVTQTRANYTLTTAHKSKGLEWPNVKLSNDFRNAPSKDKPGDNHWSEEEANLLYVAATRAQHILDCSLTKDIAHLCKSAEQAA